MHQIMLYMWSINNVDYNNGFAKKKIKLRGPNFLLIRYQKMFHTIQLSKKVIDFFQFTPA